MKSHYTNVVIHLAGTADSGKRTAIESAIAAQPGVGRAALSPRIERLLLVDYDPTATTAQHLLTAVQSHGVPARLVGM